MMTKKEKELKELDRQVIKIKMLLYKTKIKKLHKILELREEGKSYKDIAKILGTSRQGAFNVINPRFKNIWKTQLNKSSQM